MTESIDKNGQLVRKDETAPVGADEGGKQEGKQPRKKFELVEKINGLKENHKEC